MRPVATTGQFGAARSFGRKYLASCGPVGRAAPRSQKFRVRDPVSSPGLFRGRRRGGRGRGGGREGKKGCIIKVDRHECTCPSVEGESKSGSSILSGKKKSYFLGVSCVMTTQTQRNGKKSLIGEGGAIFFLNMPTEIGMRLVCRQMRQTEFSRRSSVKAYKNNMKNDL